MEFQNLQDKKKNQNTVPKKVQITSRDGNQNGNDLINCNEAMNQFFKIVRENNFHLDSYT